MLISYYEDGTEAPKGIPPPMLLLMGTNAAFASAILFAWTYLSLFVAEPLAWATWMPIYSGYGFAGVFNYPFMLLWVLPLLGIFGAWVSLKVGRKTTAYAFVAVPVVTIVLVLGWFYLTPIEWH